jgi:hypothetical protein
LAPTAAFESRTARGLPASVLSTTARTKPHATPRTYRSCTISSRHFRFSFHSHGAAFQTERLAVNQGIRHFTPGFLDDP